MKGYFVPAALQFAKNNEETLKQLILINPPVSQSPSFSISLQFIHLSVQSDIFPVSALEFVVFGLKGNAGDVRELGNLEIYFVVIPFLFFFVLIRQRVNPFSNICLLQFKT